MSNSIYEIKARIGNKIASSDIALSPVGEVLVNYFSLALKDLYDFSDTLPLEQRSKLNSILAQKEDVPKQIIQVATPKEEVNTFVLDIAKERINKRLHNSLKTILPDIELINLTLNSIRILVISGAFIGLCESERKVLVSSVLMENDPVFYRSLIWSIECKTEYESRSIEENNYELV
jgi:hypothetical protein